VPTGGADDDSTLSSVMDSIREWGSPLEERFCFRDSRIRLDKIVLQPFFPQDFECALPRSGLMYPMHQPVAE
jgi:hypothetical protein